MEKNFNTDNFEHLLRETTDEFRMYPSKRVWHSIYNDLHPARKWPSLVVVLLLATSILYLGVTNSNQATGIAKLSNVPSEQDRSLSVTAVPKASVSGGNIRNELQPVDNNPAAGNAINNHSTESFTARTGTNTLSVDNSITNVSYVAGNVTSVNNETGTTTYSNSVNNDAEITGNTDEQYSTRSVSKDVSGVAVNILPTSPVTDLADLSSISTTGTDKQNKKINVSGNMTMEDKKWMDVDVLYNKKAGRKYKNRIAYQVYVTPSVGYRELTKNTDYEQPATSNLISNPGQVNTMEYGLNHSSAINLEAGTNLLFSFSKKVRFKAGLQLNYTNYRIYAYELNHPTFTTLMLNDADGYPVLSSRRTSLANTPGLPSKNLNNNSYQVSIPIGADFKLAGNNKLKWYAGATVQPTYVADGHSYLISSDLKNYVQVDGMMRKFNLNAGVETFVSYKARNGVILSAGPQFRYQFLSTYNSQYTYDEKLYNLGIKLGMTTNF